MAAGALECLHGAPGEVAAAMMPCMVELIHVFDKDVAAKIKSLPTDADLLQWAQSFRGMTVDALLKHDAHHVTKFWFRYLVLRVAADAGHGAAAAACVNYLGESQSFVASLETIARALIVESPCDCVAKMWIGEMGSGEIGSLLAPTVRFLQDDHSSEDDAAIEDRALQLGFKLEQAELAGEEGCLREAAAFLKKEDAVALIFNAIASCTKHSGSKAAQSFTTDPDPPCLCRHPMQGLAGLVVLKPEQMSCNRCGSVCTLRPSRQSLILSTNMWLAIRLLKVLGRSDSTASLIGNRAPVLVSAIGNSYLPFFHRANAAGVLIPVVRQLDALKPSLDAVADFLEDVCMIELECQSQYVTDPLIIATMMLQSFPSVAKQHILSKMYHLPRNGGRAPHLPAAVCVLLWEHTHSIMETGLGTQLCPTLREQADGFRDKHGMDKRPMLIFLCLDFLVALQVAGVRVKDEVQTPSQGQSGRHCFESFGESLKKYIDTLEDIAVQLRCRHMKAQLDMLLGLREAAACFNVVDFAKADSLGVTLTKSICSACGKSGLKLMKCMGCKIAMYCSADCQKKDWQTHKSVCSTLSKRVTSAPRVAAEETLPSAYSDATWTCSVDSDCDSDSDDGDHELPFSIGFTPGLNFLQDMRALGLKEEAQRWQKQGEYEKALRLMKRSVQLREHSHTICLSLSELAALYLDMLRFEDAEDACHRMMQEASTPYRYDCEQQVRIANGLLQEIEVERQQGISYGMHVRIQGLTRDRKLNGLEGVVQGRLASSGNVIRIVVKIGMRSVNVQRQNIEAISVMHEAQRNNWQLPLRSTLKLTRSSTSGVTATSCTSITSAAGPHPKCYVPGTGFRCLDGNLTLVQDLQQHEMLLGHGEDRVEVVDIACHPRDIRKLTWLLTEDGSTLVVTSDHRIIVPRGEEQQTIPAGNLRVDNVILCAGGEQRLLGVEHTDLAIEVYQVTFKPDAPVETFYDQGAILTKGFKRRIKTRRSGMNKNQDILEQRSVVPSTFDPYERDMSDLPLCSIDSA